MVWARAQRTTLRRLAQHLATKVGVIRWLAITFVGLFRVVLLVPGTSQPHSQPHPQPNRTPNRAPHRLRDREFYLKVAQHPLGVIGIW